MAPEGGDQLAPAVSSLGLGLVSVTASATCWRPFYLRVHRLAIDPWTRTCTSKFLGLSCGLSIPTLRAPSAKTHPPILVQRTGLAVGDRSLRALHPSGPEEPEVLEPEGSEGSEAFMSHRQTEWPENGFLTPSDRGGSWPEKLKPTCFYK